MLYRIIDQEVFQRGYDAPVTPTVATTRIPADFDLTIHAALVKGRKVNPYAGWFLTSLFSLLNWMPAINVPTGLAANGVPTGLQIATRPYNDATVAALASLYATQMPPPRPPRHVTRRAVVLLMHFLFYPIEHRIRRHIALNLLQLALDRRSYSHLLGHV